MFNNEQKFIMCFVNKISISLNSQYHQLYCQTLIQENNNQLIIKNIYTIDNELIYVLRQSNYINNIPIKILVYEHTIYILLEMIDSSATKRVTL